MSRSAHHSRCNSNSQQGGISKSLSRTYSWVAEPPPKQACTSLVHLNFFLYSHAEATVPPMEMSAELTAIGEQQSHDLCAKLAAIEFDDVFVSPTTQCRQSVFPLCLERKCKYSADWSLMDRIVSQRQISSLQDGCGGVPGHLRSVQQQLERRKYMPWMDQGDLIGDGPESTQRVSDRLEAFVEHLYEEVYLDKMRRFNNNFSAAGIKPQRRNNNNRHDVSPDVDEMSRLDMIQAEMLGLGMGLDLSDEAREEQELNEHLADIDSMLRVEDQPKKRKSRLFSNNILICASPHTIDRLMAVLSLRVQPHQHHQKRTGDSSSMAPMDHLQLFSGQ